MKFMKQMKIKKKIYELYETNENFKRKFMKFIKQMKTLKKIYEIYETNEN